MIDTEGLTKRYDGRTVVEDVSFRCEPGTVTGFLGPNGAGKTTTMRVHGRALTTPTPAEATIARQALPRPARTPAATSASCSTPRRSTPAAAAARC